MLFRIVSGYIKVEQQNGESPSHGSGDQGMLRKLLISALVVTAPYAIAETFVVLGRALDLVPPAGYCSLGGSDLERHFFERFKSLAEPAGQLLQVSMPCVDLARAKTGSISQFPRTANVMVIKARGQLRIDTRSRAEFLSELGEPGAINIESANKRLRAAMAEADVAANLGAMRPLGTDGIAFYWNIVGTAKINGASPQALASVSAAVLVNGLPLNVQVTENAGSTDSPALVTVAKSYVTAIVSRN